MSGVNSSVDLPIKMGQKSSNSFGLLNVPRSEIKLQMQMIKIMNR